MLLVLKNYRYSTVRLMRAAGYTYREDSDDWIRSEGLSGQFHVTRTPESRVLEIHYDVFIENRHVTFKLTEKYRNEKYRILGKIRMFKKHDYTLKEFNKILSRVI